MQELNAAMDTIWKQPSLVQYLHPQHNNLVKQPLIALQQCFFQCEITSIVHTVPLFIFSLAKSIYTTKHERYSFQVKF